MRKICVINQKGGVGKTTTTVNIAHGLAKEGRRVLIIDFDPQGNVSNCLATRPGKTIYNFLIESVPIEQCIQKINNNLFVLPANETLTKAEFMLAGESARETFLTRKLAKFQGFDYVFIDCPPSLGLLNQNALLYADESIIPTSTDELGFDALNKMEVAIDTMNNVFGHKMKVSAIVPTMYDARLKNCKVVLTEIQNKYYQIVTNPIRTNSKLREAPKDRVSIFEYDKYGRGSKDYKKVVEFIMHQEESEPMNLEDSSEGVKIL